MKYIKKIFGIGFAFLLTLVVVPAAFAAPTQPNYQNPNVVVYYVDGEHAIVGETDDVHTGMDLVMLRGNNGKIQQWFYGTSENEPLHGDHSVWNLAKPDGTCANGWIAVYPAYPDWGDYLKDAVYCVKTNDYRVSQ